MLLPGYGKAGIPDAVGFTNALSFDRQEKGCRIGRNSRQCVPVRPGGELSPEKGEIAAGTENGLGNR